MYAETIHLLIKKKKREIFPETEFDKAACCIRRIEWIYISK